MNFFDQFNKSNIIIAHRGNRRVSPENTIEAFRQAIGKSDMFEFDIQYTKDFQPIVIHDDSLVRTTNVKKVFKNRNFFNIRDFTLKEIQNLDNISWFIKNDPFSTIKNKEVSIRSLVKLQKNSIATLDEVLLFMKINNFPANLEIKNSDFFEIGSISQNIAKKISKYEVSDICIISSFNHKYLKKIKKENSSFFIAALFEEMELSNILDYLKDLQVDAYHIDKTLANEDKIRLLEKNNIFTNVYTINKETEKKKLFEEGVKSIFTDAL